MEMIRTFIGIHLSPALLSAFESLIARLQQCPGSQAARWVPAKNIHLTLKFLGDVPAEQLPRIYGAVEHTAACHAPFQLEVANVGCFPNTRRPRVVWVGLKGDLEALLRLQGDLEGALERLGYPRERRPFTPHLTIARVKQQAVSSEVAALGQSIATYGPVTLGIVDVSRIHVIKSTLQPSGAVYTDLSSAQLGAERLP